MQTRTNQDSFVRNVRPQDEIPPEAELKMLARRYDRLYDQAKSLLDYSKSLEAEKADLQKKMDILFQKMEREPDVEAENKQLRSEIKILNHQLKDKEKRIKKHKVFTKLIVSQRYYIFYLQNLLRENDVAYKERRVLDNPLENIGNEDIIMMYGGGEADKGVNGIQEMS
ncbi:MAG: hypothetical protein IJQ11_07370 [Bacteroidales bacterium]|nr:hypothetical protein [Bacteroidales bacterium]